MADNIDPVGAAGTVVALIGTLRELAVTVKNKWDCYNEVTEQFIFFLLELEACKAQWNDLLNAYESAKDVISEEMKRSYIRLINSQEKKFDQIEKVLKNLKEKIPQTSSSKKWLFRKIKDVKAFAYADKTSETISKFVNDLSELSKEGRSEITNLEEKRGDKYEPYFHQSNMENVILDMDDDMTPEGKLKKAVKSCGDVTAVLGSSSRNKVSASSTGGTTSVEGLGGIGKTTALQGLANDETVKKTFKDGVFFMTFGKEADDQKWIENLRLIVEQTGGKKLSETLKGDLKSVIKKTKEWFKNKNTLFICDDLWPTPSNTIKYLSELKELRQCSSTCHVVLSTRYGEIASNACEKSGTVVKVEILEPLGRKARDVLFSRADVSNNDYESLPETEKSAMGDIMQKCGGLPFALTVAGRLLYDSKKKSGLLGAVQKLYSKLSSNEEDLLDINIGEHRVTLYRCFRESLERIHEWAKEADLGDCWSSTIPRLCVYRKTTKLTKEMMKYVWLEDSHDPKILHKVVDKLRNFHLLEFEEDAELYTFHDLFHDFCIRKAGGEREVPKLHREFLDNVAKRCGVVNPGQSSAERICGRSWWNLKDVGGIEVYMRSNLSRHLKEADKVDELEALMSRFEWTLHRFRKHDYNEMMNDLSIWVHEEEKKWKDANEDRSKYIKKRKMRQAISSAWSKSENEQELACQILSHLLDSRDVSETVEMYIASVESIGMKGWLRPLQQVWEVPSADVINVQFWIKEISVNWMRNQAIVVGGKGQIALLNLSSHNVRVLFNEIGRIVTCVAWSESGNTVILGSEEGEIMKCNIDEETFQTVYNVGGDVTSVDISEDGSRVVFASDDETIRVLDVESRKELRVFEGLKNSLSSVAISGDGSRVVSGLDDKTVRVWDVGKGEEWRVFEGYERGVSSVAISGDGSRVVSGSYDRTVRVWEVEKRAELCVFEGHESGVSSVAISRDGCRVVSESGDGTYQGIVRVWDVESRKELCVFEGNENWLSSVAISGDGSRVVGSDVKSVRVWDVDNRDELYVHESNQKRSCSVAISGDRSRVVSGSYDKSVRVWDVEKGEELCVFEGHESVVLSVAISGDGNRVVSVSDDRTVRVWDAEKGTELCILVGHEDSVSSVSISEDGNRVVSGSWDKTVRVWDVEKGAELCVLEGHEDSVWCVAMNGDGNRVVSGSWDKTVRFWDVEKGVELCVLEGHESEVSSVAVSGDGCRVVSGAWDKTVRVWNVENKEELCVLESHEWGVSSVATSGDGRIVASRLEDGQLLIWKAKDNGYGHKPNYVLFPKLCFRESYDVGFIGQQVVIGFGDGRILQYDMIE